MKRIYAVIQLLGACLFISACAATHQHTASEATASDGTAVTVTAPESNINAQSTGTPSPLNTNANPWTNVNPQIQGQMHQARIPSR